MILIDSLFHTWSGWEIVGSGVGGTFGSEGGGIVGVEGGTRGFEVAWVHKGGEGPM